MRGFLPILMILRSVSYKTSGPRGRTPVIKFRHGYHKTQQATGTGKSGARKYTAASLEPFSFQDIMQGWNDESRWRRPVTEEQIQVINSGGAGHIVNRIPKPKAKKKGKPKGNKGKPKGKKGKSKGGPAKK